MIKIENVEIMGWEHVIRGMRNPMNSWEKSDSGICKGGDDGIGCRNCAAYDCEHTYDQSWQLGKADHELMMRLAAGGPTHAKYRRMITVYMDITAPLYWWKEFDTYKVGTVANSCSTMHKISEKKFTLEDFSHEYLIRHRSDDNKGYSEVQMCADSDVCICFPEDILMLIIDNLNVNRDAFLETKDKKYWWQMIQLLPSSYNQTRNVMLNYEVLANIYRQRKNHKLDEWREVCKWIETLPYSELITGISIGSDQSIEEKRFPQPFPWIKDDDVYCNNCEHFHDCLNKGVLADVTTGNDITKGRYINKPGYDCPKGGSDNE